MFSAIRTGRSGLFFLWVRTALCMLLLCGAMPAAAQKSAAEFTPRADTSDKVTITIANAENFVATHTDSGDYNKFIRNVVLYQGTDTLHCDSLYQNNVTKNFEAFGNVKIAQMGGTHGSSDYLRYTTSQKVAYMSGNVSLTDGKNTMIGSELTYYLGTKIAVYDNWGQLHNDSTTVTSKSGVYNSAAKTSRFKQHVLVQDPQYLIHSEDMEYNTDTKLTTFYSESVVTRDNGKSILKTSDGTYDGMHGVAHFKGHSSIWNDGQYLEGDTISYSKLSGYGMADGNVISIDTQHHSVLFCGHTEYYSRRKVSWAWEKPVLLQVNGKDSFYMRADTFYSAPMHKAKPKEVTIRPIFARQDSILAIGPPHADTIAKSAPDTAYPPPTVKKTAPKPAPQKTGGARKNVPQKKIAAENKPAQHFEVPVTADTADADTAAPLYFIGYHHVLIFSDSLQAKCDSICYTRSDSIVRMMYKPIAWAHNSQVTGDTIILQLDSAHLKKMYVPSNSFMVSQSGPAKAKLFDQVQGKSLTAWFDHSTIERMKVFPDAQSIYYSKDDKGYYMGVVQAQSDTMQVFFNNQKIQRIVLKPEVHETLTPMEKADLPGMKLSRFKWLIDLRPKSKEELFK